MSNAAKTVLLHWTLFNHIYSKLTNFLTSHDYVMVNPPARNDICPTRHSIAGYISFSHEIDRSAFQQLSWTHARISTQIDTPLSPRARSLWRSFFLPFYRPTHSFCACLSACSDIYDMSHSFRTFMLFYFLEY